MKKSRKIVIGALVLLLVIALSVGGTIAFLTSTTAEVKNTFTIGKVAITLDEAPTNEYGTVQSGDRVTANEYKLVPGHEYAKDPTVHVDPASETCYIFVKVVNQIAALEASGNTIKAQIAANEWAALGTDYPGVYYKTWTGSEAVDLVVFDTFTLADDADLSTLTESADSVNGVDEVITIIAYAIQADGFNDAASAWTAGGFGN